MPTAIAISPTAQANVGVTDPANVYANDDAYARFDSNSDTITVSGFSASTGTIGRVRICVRGKRGGVANAQFTVSYELSGTPTGSTAPMKFTSPNEALIHVDVTNDRAWTWTDISNLGVTLAGANLSASRLGDVDHIFIEVTTHDGDPLITPGQFKTFIINSTPLKVIETPSGSKSYNINILNHDRNTQYVYISHDANVSAGNGWELIPTANYITACGGAVDFWIVSPDITQEITVSMHEV